LSSLSSTGQWVRLKSAPLALPPARCHIVTMPTRASKKRPRDFAQRAKQVVEEAIGERLDGTPLEPELADTRNPAAVALSELGASKGGKVRAANLSRARRVEIAKNAAKARWRA
jgi:hypothetical protein